MRGRSFFFLVFAVGCGARSGIPFDDIELGIEAGFPPVGDAGSSDASAPAMTCPSHCTSCKVVRFVTQQSCSIAVQSSSVVLDGVGFLDPGFQEKGVVSSGRVFAMMRWGQGRIAEWCDSTIANDFLTKLDLPKALGLATASRLGITGAAPNDYCPTIVRDATGGTVFAWPGAYAGKPDLLAKDFDVIVFCAVRGTWSPSPTADLQSYVSVQGKSLVLVNDYFNAASTDFQNTNAILAPTGLALEAVSLRHWAANVWLGMGCR